MNFDRFRTQEECEKIYSCNNLTDWKSSRAAFERLVINPQLESTLTPAIIEDGKDLYYKGLLSLSEAIQSLNRNLYSWATVKAYYSIFYLLRSSLALKGYSLVRNISLYLLRIKVGSTPIKRVSKKYRNDHVCTINTYVDLFGSTDILQSNSIDGINPYEWMMERRNQINYRQRQFYDPDPPDFLKAIALQIEDKKLDQLINTYVQDTSYLYCFQSDHACLALPIRRLLLTKKEYCELNVKLELSPDRYKLITKLLNLDSKQITSYESFMSPVT